MVDSPYQGSEESPESKGRSASSSSRSRSGSRSLSRRSARVSSRSCETSDFSRRRSRGYSSSYTRSDSYSGSRSPDYYSDRSRSYTHSRCGRDRRSPERHRSEVKTPDRKRIAIFGISKNVNESHLREIFGVFGIISKIFILASRAGFTLDGYPCNRSVVYIEYRSSEAAEEAIAAMNKGAIDGSDIRVEYTEQKPPPVQKHYPVNIRRVSRGRLTDSRDDYNSSSRFSRGYGYGRSRDWEAPRGSNNYRSRRIWRSPDRYSGRDNAGYRSSRRGP